MQQVLSRALRTFLAATPAVFAFTAPVAQVDPETAAAIRREGLEESEVMEILAGLTGEVGHRLTGSDSFTYACNWAEAKFQSMGLPHVKLEKWGTWPVVWNREQWQGRVVEPEPLELQVATEAWTNGTLGKVRGPILPMPSDAEELEELGDAIDGAWLFGALPSRRSGFLEELLEGTTGRVAGFLYSSRGDNQYPNRMRVFGSFPRSDRIADTPPRIMIRRDQAEKIGDALEPRERTLVGGFRAGRVDRREQLGGGFAPEHDQALGPRVEAKRALARPFVLLEREMEVRAPKPE